MHTIIQRVLVALALVAAVSVCTSSAHACHDNDHDVVTVGCFSTLYAGASTLLFGTAEIVYALDDSWLPSGWAWAQLLAAGAPPLVAGVAVMVAAPGLPESHMTTEALVWGAVAATLGAWYTTNGILSLVSYEEPAGPSVGLVPLPGGAAASVRGAF